MKIQFGQLFQVTPDDRADVDVAARLGRPTT